MEEKQIENFDKIEEMNRAARNSKIHEEKRMRERMMNEKIAQMERKKAQDEENDRMLIENNRLALEREKQRIEDLKAHEKEKLLEIYADNQKKRIVQKKEQKLEHERDNELMLA